MSLDPIRATQAITENYLNYLSTTFHINDPDLQRQFEDQLHVPDKFIKGPILEATPPFKPGASLADLISIGLLSASFRRLDSKKFPLERPLYLHQQEAIEKAVNDHRNLVIASGTGSGKTEAFLIPILEKLFREGERGVLEPGVRALLLYPMNALANDQVARLRELLKNAGEITFGRYTGETKEGQQEALEYFRDMYHEEPLPNERISREHMRVAPPNILLTNYAMLEYLLLRPDDNKFFDGPFSGHWSAIVVDEAHTFTGAKGIEMAMLLRRLKDRVVTRSGNRLQCFATSATLGSGPNSYQEVVTFAERLFGEEFKWDVADPSHQDVVRAVRLPLAADSIPRWTPSSSIYQSIRMLISDELSDPDWDALVLACEQTGLPHSVIDRAVEKGKSTNSIEIFLYEVLKDDSRLHSLRLALEERPRLPSDLAGEIFLDEEDSLLKLVALVDLAARAKPSSDDQSLIPARYHLFVRAIEGAYLTLQPERKIFLERHISLIEDGQENRVFEIATCRHCGSIYLVGEVKEINGRAILDHPGTEYFDNPTRLRYFLLRGPKVEIVPDDEDEMASENQDVDVKEWRLCGCCGAIDRIGSLTSLCDCERGQIFTVSEAKASDGNVCKCPVCSARNPNGILWRFLTGADAAAGVLATSLYETIPPRLVKNETRTTALVSDRWTLPANPEEDKGKKVRQLLIFSDSRQDAAFFAPYLNRTHGQILRRRLILEILDQEKERVLSHHWHMDDLINPIVRIGTRLKLFRGLSAQQKESEAWRWVLHELLALDRRNSLEGLGLLGFAAALPEDWQPFAGFQDYGLREDETRVLYQVLLESFRLKGAIVFPDILSPTDDFFSPKNHEYFFTRRRPTGLKNENYVFGWLPPSNRFLNRHLDFLLRILTRAGAKPVHTDLGIEILDAVWSNDLFNPDQTFWEGLFEESYARSGLPTYRLRPDLWELRPGRIDPSIPWYICDTCHNLTLFNLRGVCPTYRCPGDLHLCDPTKIFSANHYRHLYTSGEPIHLIAKEHTAQLTSARAASLQTEFKNGDVNVLSCSTTFELGVDVGELESVFMRNVPPGAANYIQRAGRSGRRTSSTAFALTFAQRRSHDLTHFNDPLKFITGEIKPPYFEIANEKVVRRHIYAATLAAFWREHPETFKTVESFFFRPGQTGPDLIRAFLSVRPPALKSTLDRIIPAGLRSSLQIDTWGWINGLLDPGEGCLSLATDRVLSDVASLDAARRQLIQENKRSDYLLNAINTIKDEYLISYLSTQNVLPKYGFPVDVVDLQILHHSEEAKSLDLSRDLRIALSEYAPGGQVVAAGKLWTSTFIKRVPEHAWPRYRYAVCAHCNNYQRVLAVSDDISIDTCEYCHQPIDRDSLQGIFIVPKFGFMTSTDAPGNPGEARPERTYATRTYYRGGAKEDHQLDIHLHGLTASLTPAADGELAILNHANRLEFKVCDICGFAIIGDERAPKPHKTPWHSDCPGRLKRVSLGHEFKTDILKIILEGYSNVDQGFWLSLLYCLLEGASQSMEIDRQDIDGVLYPFAGDRTRPAIILFDNVPGGAGHVRRIAERDQNFTAILEAALSKLENCDCGEPERNTSCYGCLRNYQNQFCHGVLSRGPVIKFLQSVLGHSERPAASLTLKSI